MGSNKYQYRVVSVLFFYVILFHTMFFQGAYYISGLLILNIAFLLYIIITKKPFRFDLPLLGFLIIFFLVLLSNLFFSINYYIGIGELLKYSLFPLTYTVFKEYEDKETLGNIFYRSFILLMVFGLFAWFGFSLMPGMVTVKSHRLQSFLQYANTTALFMGIGLLLSIDKYFQGKKKRFLFLGFLFGIALFLTKSRTTFVIFLFILAFYLFGFLNKKAKMIFLSGIGVSFVLMVLAGARIAKIKLTEPTLIERLITFYDGVHILWRKPWGIGLGNWQFMQFKYQSAPYQVRYIHNIFLQMALDGGVLVPLFFIAIILLYFFRNYKTKNVNFYIFLLIVLQSFFEISFNYGIVIAYFTFLLTLLKQPGSVLKESSSKFRYILIVPCVALVFLLISESYIAKGNRSLHKNPLMAYNAYTQAHQINPFNSELYFKKAQVVSSSKKALELLEAGYERNPYDFQILLSLAEGYLYGGQMEKAYFYANELLSVFPYHKRHQQLMYKVLEETYTRDQWAEEEYRGFKKEVDARILEYNNSIHRWYYYINAQMDY
ncbi:MAG: hypothetical protein GX238_04100 [Epulopiscium sp.]|nr:hypothetical protein [Candidatus Epulonipiscium sp.]